MDRRQHNRVMAAFAVLLGAACTEPTDCAAEPERCPLVKGGAAVVRGPSAAAPAHVLAEARGRRADQERAGQQRAAAAQGAQLDQAARARLRAAAEIEAKNARVGDLTPQEQDHRTPEGLIRRIRNVAANHNLKGLKRFMTPGFADRVDTMMKESPERFWRHLDRYVNAAEHGFELTSSPGPREGTLELRVNGRDEMTLRPIVQRSERGWLFDRF